MLRYAPLLVLLLPLAFASNAWTDPAGDVHVELGLFEPAASEFACHDDRVDLVAASMYTVGDELRFNATVVDVADAPECVVAGMQTIPLEGTPTVEFEFEGDDMWLRVEPFPGGGYALSLNTLEAYADVEMLPIEIDVSSYVVRAPRYVPGFEVGTNEPTTIDLTAIEWAPGKVVTQARDHLDGVNTLFFAMSDRADLSAPTFG